MSNLNLIDEIVDDNYLLEDKTEIIKPNSNIQDCFLNKNTSNGNNLLIELKNEKEEVDFNAYRENEKISYSSFIFKNKENNISTIKSNDLQSKPNSFLDEKINVKIRKEKEFEVPEKIFNQKMKNYENQNNGVTDYLKTLEENFQIFSSRKNKDDNINSNSKSRLKRFYDTNEPDNFYFLQENMCKTVYLEELKRSLRKSQDSQFFQNIIKQIENEKVIQNLNFNLENANFTDYRLNPKNYNIDEKDLIKNKNENEHLFKLFNVELSNESFCEVEIDFDKNNEKNYTNLDYHGNFNNFNQKNSKFKHYINNQQKKNSNNSVLMPISNFSQISNNKNIISNTVTNIKAKSYNEHNSNVSTDPNTNTKIFFNKNNSNLLNESVNQNIKRLSVIENYKKSNIVPILNLNSLISNNNDSNKSEKDNNLNNHKNKEDINLSNNFNYEIPLNQKEKNIENFKKGDEKVNFIEEQCIMEDYVLNTNTRTVYIDANEAKHLEVEENYDKFQSPINRYAYMYINDLPVCESVRYDSVNVTTILKKDSLSSNNNINNNYINQNFLDNSIEIANNSKFLNYENPNCIDNVVKNGFSQQTNFKKTFSDNIDDYLSSQQKVIDQKELNAFFILLQRRFENYFSIFLTEMQNCKLFNKESDFSTIGSVSSLENYIELKFQELLNARKPISDIDSLEKIIFKWRNVKDDNNSFYRAVIYSYIENILLNNNDLDFLILIKEIFELTEKNENKIIYTNNDINCEFLIGSLFFILYAKNLKNFNDSNSIFEYFELLMNNSQDFDLGLVLFLRIKIYEFIEMNKSKIYSKQFNVKLGELLPITYIDDFNDFLWEKFYKENLLKLDKEAGKISKYLIPFILNINLKIFSYEYEKVNSEDFNNFGFQNSQRHTALIFSKNNHYDLIYSKDYFANIKDKIIRLPVHDKSNVDIEDLKNLEKATHLDLEDLNNKNENQSNGNEGKIKITNINNISKINNLESFNLNLDERMSLKFSDKIRKDIYYNNDNIVSKDGRFISDYRLSKDDTFTKINLFNKIEHNNNAYLNRQDEMESPRKKNSISLDVRKRNKNGIFENNSCLKSFPNNNLESYNHSKFNSINNKNYLLNRSQIDFNNLKLQKSCNFEKDIGIDKINYNLNQRFNNLGKNNEFNECENSLFSLKRTGKINESGEYLFENKISEIQNGDSNSFRKCVCNLCNGEFDRCISNFMRTFICKSCFDKEFLKEVSSKITNLIESSLLELLDNRLKPYDLTYFLKDTEIITVLDKKNEIKFYKELLQINLEEIVAKILNENCLMCLLDKSRFCDSRINYVLPCKCNFSSLLHFRIFLTKLFSINIENKSYKNFTCVCNKIYSVDQLIKIFEIINENEFQHEFQMLKNYLLENIFKNFCCICKKSFHDEKNNFFLKVFYLKDYKFESEMNISKFYHYSCFECTEIINKNTNLSNLYKSFSTFNCNLCVRQHLYVSDFTNQNISI